MTTVKITELSDIGANLASSTVVPVVNMAGTPITQKTNVGNIANLILEGAGVDYSEASVALLAQTVSNAAQPNITSVGTLTNVVVSGNATVNGNITSNGTAYVGNLSTTGVASITTLDVGTTANLGSIANVIITGGTIGQILSTDGEGNLSWTSDATSYGDSNVVTLLSAFGSNTITTTGNVSVGNITATNLGNIATINLDGNASNVLRGDGTFGADANSSYGDSNVVSLLAAFGSNTISTTGIITADGANLSNVPYANLTGSPSLGNISNINLDGNASNLLSGAGTYVAIPVMPTVGNIATINLDGSNSNVLYGNGVFAAVAGGGNTGNVTFSNQIVIGTGGNDGTGGLYLASGPDGVANTQYLRVRGGDNFSHIHLDTSNSQAYDQYFGNDAKYVKLELGDAGNVVVGTDDAAGNSYNWTFTSGGNFILANGNSVIQSIANSSLDPTLPNVSTMVLTPDANYNSQVLVLDPTAPGHIHLRAYAFSNIDEPAANIFLGGEDTAFEVTSGANNEVRIHSGGNTWTFDNAGNLTLPGNTFAVNYANGTQVSISGANTGNIIFDQSVIESNESNAYINLNASGSGILSLGTNDQSNVRIVTDEGNVNNQWTFDTTGNLTIPSTSGGFIKTASNASIGIVAMDNGTNNPAQLLSMNVGNGNATSIVSAYATNVAIQTNASGAINTWQFDNAGNLTLPGNISGNTNGYTIGYLNIPQVAASNTTIALTDAGKHYYSTTAGNLTLTIPNNATTSFATGTAISIVVQAAGNILVNADTGVTLYMAGNSSAANRVVGGYGMATLMKVGTDTWFINGTGVS